MRKIREALRLSAAGLSGRQIAASLSIGNGTVWDYLQRAKAAGLSWPLSPDLDEASLERLLFPSTAPTSTPFLSRSLPDCPHIHEELRRPGVTLALLWQEYKAVTPDGYQYSRFCERYREWAGKVDLVMRQEHRAGERLFVDYAGQTVEVIDRATGEVRSAQIFVAVMGASSYTYAEATWSQSSPDWIGSHMRAFSFMGAVPAIVVPDNLRSGVSRSCRYEPDVNPSYADMAAHYGVAVIPARVRRPRDKAKVEAGVLLVERWILARLRNRTFFRLAELNAAIRELLAQLNDRPFRKLPGSRRSAFESIDLPAMKGLPARPYEYAGWKKVRVNIDYHVEVEGSWYSVPHQLARQELDARLTKSVVELLHKGVRVASHVKSQKRGRYVTVTEHMPKSHQAHREWTPQRIIQWAGSTGPSTAALVEAIMVNKPHPEQGYRSCLGIMRLGKTLGHDRLEAACKRALAVRAVSYRSVKSILDHELDKKPLPVQESLPVIGHEQVRGPGYYH